MVNRENLKKLKTISYQMITTSTVDWIDTISIIKKLRTTIDEKTITSNQARHETLELLQSLNENS